MSKRDRNARRWLHADLVDVVQVVPRDAQARSQDGVRVELTDGLRRWTHRLARQRSLAVLRRQLLIGGTLAALAALVILIVGGARPWWLALAGLAFGLGCSGIAWLRRPSLQTAAQLLDRELTLHDRLGTALELQAAGTSRGLAGLVRGEADVAVGRSLRQARARLTPAGREWAWLAVVALALAVLIAVPRGGASSGPLTGHKPPPHGLIPPGQVATIPGAAGRASQTPVGANVSPANNVESRTPAASRGNGANPYSYNGKQYKNNATAPSVAPGQLAKPPKLNLTSIGSSTPGGSGSGSGNRGADGSGGQSGSSSHSAAGQGGAKLGNPGGGGSNGAGAGGLKPSGGSGQGSKATTPSGSSGAAQGSQQGSGSAPPGGESAGSTRAPALGQSSGISAAQTGSDTSLPLQGGFQPVGGKGTGAKGGPQQEQGGGGSSRTATVGGSGSSGGNGNFAALAPTFNSPSGNSSVTSYYFGTANQLTFKGW